jgi:hypothetical protein
MLPYITNNDAKLYAKSLLEPFHPDSMGTRVPMVLPRETISFSSFKEISVNGSHSTKVIMFANFESQDELISITFKDNAIVDAIIGSPPELVSNIVRDGVNYNGHVIRAGVVANFKDATKFETHSETGFSRAFVKSRTVAAGIRVFKTSVSENESGVLDVLYSRDGGNVDSSTKIVSGLGRPKNDRHRQYLAQTGGEDCRGQCGFSS